MNNFFDIQRFAYISNSNSNTLISGTSDDDEISNWYGSNVTINAGSGNDSIDNYLSSNVTINAGAGNDSIENSSANVEIYGGDGNDILRVYRMIIHNSETILTENILMDGGDGDDSIDNYASSVSINAGAGKDTIRNGGSNVTINAGAGNDSINNDGENVTINTGAGDDSIYNSGKNVTINAGDGNDSIYNNWSSNVTINAGAGDDSIYNSGKNVTINAGAGNDSIENYFDNHVTIDAGAGADYIDNYSGNYIIISGGDDNDSITSTRSNDVTIYGGNGNDSIRNYGGRNKSVIIDAGIGDDYIENCVIHYSDNSIGGQNTTIIGGAGNDIISLSHSGTYEFQDALIKYKSGDGNDIIYGFKAHDTLQISDAKYTTTKSGSDLIVGVGSGKITLVGAANTAVNIDGTLDGGGNDTTPPDTTPANTLPAGWKFANTLASATLTTADDLDLNESYGAAITKVDASKITGGVVIYGNSKNNSIKGSKGADTIYGGDGNDTVSLGSGADIYVYSGGDDIILDYTAGQDSIQIDISEIEITGVSTVGSNIVYETSEGNLTVKNGKGKNIILMDADGDEITIGGGGDDDSITNITKNTTVRGTASADYIINYAGGVKIYAGEGNDYIYNSTNANYTINNSWGYVTIDAGAGNDSITNNDPYVSISGGAGNDFIYNNNYSYVTINGGTGNDTVSLGGGSYKIYQYAAGDGNDIIYGINSTDTLNISGSYTTAKSGSDLIVSVGSGKITFKNTSSVAIITDAINTLNSTSYVSITTASGNDTIRNTGSRVTVVANDGNDIVSNTGVSMTAYGGAGNDSIYNNANYGRIYAGDGADTVYSGDGGDYAYIDAGYGNDSIYSNDGDCMTIAGGAGVDTISGYYWSSSISGGADSDIISISGGGYYNTINGGTGNDVIYTSSVISHYYTYQYASGDGYDTIRNYSAYDTISIGGSASYQTLTSGNDIQISIGSGSILLSGAKGKTLNIVGGTYVSSNDSITNYTKNTTVRGTANADSIRNYAGGVKIYAGDGNDYIYNSTDSNYTINNSYCYVTIDAGAGNDFIYSNDPYVSISGGAGNDTIFFYDAYSNYNIIKYASGDGNDIIEGIKENDTLKITGAKYTTTESGEDLIVSVGSGKITVVGGANIGFTIEGTLDNSNSKLITGTSGADNISNTLASATINALAGNDTIENTGHHAIIYGGAGKDSIVNANRGGAFSLAGAYSYIDAGADDDYILNYDWAGYVTVDAGAGNDTICSRAAESTIFGGAGNDSIRNVTSNVSISGGDGNDIILDEGFISGINNKNTINGGKGNDIITLSSSGYNNVIQYMNGDGNDFIYNLSSSDTLHITSGSVSSSVSGSDVILKVGSGTITLKDAVDQSFYLKIGNNSAVSTIFGSEDTLPDGWKYANTAKTSITATLASADDLDLTEDYGAGVIKVDGSKTTGGVVIYGNSLSNSIKGGKGADEIFGGAGNDTVSLGSGNDTYIYSGGNDLIQDYVAGQDKIKFETEIESASLSGSNLIITTSEGKVTVTKGKDKNVSVIDSNGETFTIYNEYPTVNPYPAGISVNGVTLTASNSFTGNEIDIADYEGVTKVNAAALTRGVSIIGDSSANSLKGGKGADKIYGDGGNDTVSLGGGKDTYIYSSGNDLIQDYKAGEDKIKFETEIESASVNGSNLIITTSEGKVTVTKGKDKNVTVIDSNGDTFTIYNEYPTLPPNTDTVITLTDKADNETYSEDNITVDALGGHDEIAVAGNYISINAGDGNDKITIEYGAKEVTVFGGKDHDEITNNGGKNTVYEYISGNGDDIIKGYQNGDTLKIKGNYSYDMSGNDFIIKVGQGSIKLPTVGTVEDMIINIVDEGGNLETIAALPLPAGWKYDTKKTKLTATSTAKNINLNEIFGGDNVESVDASKSTEGIEITAHDNGVSIKGGKGGNLITGGAGNDTVLLGNGADTYIYTGGDDSIKNYVGGKGFDIIQIEIDGINYKNAADYIQCDTIDNNHIVYTFGNSYSGKIFVENAASEEINLVDVNGKVISFSKPPQGWQFVESKNLLQATSSSADNTVDLNESYGAGVEKVDGSKISGGVVIFGNDLGNSIKGGKGADEITGGSGNDTVSLGAGADTYIYTGGDDIITDYASVDAIQIDTSEINFIDIDDSQGTAVVCYTENSGTLTIKKGGNKKININEITIVDENGDPYPITSPIPKGWTLDSTKKKLTATVKAPEDIDLTQAYGVNIETVDASKDTSGVEIIGNDLDNSIKGSKGADIISGGDGNDIVSLGGGNDIYIYTGGDDVIQDYAEGKDSIQIDTDNIEITGVSTVNGSDLMYETSAGNLKVVKGKGKEITFMDTSGDTINFSNSSRNVAENIWFLEDDDNFVASDIDSIVEEKFAVTNIETKTYEDFAQDENILTFAKDK